MSSIITELDPIRGLLGYIHDVKPYHTKVVEILTEYRHGDEVVVNITEDFNMDITFIYSDDSDSFGENTDDGFIGALGTYGGNTPYGGVSNWPVLSPTITAAGPFDPTSLGYDSVNSFIIIPGDRTAQYAAGKSIVVNIYNSTNDEIINSSIYTILTAVYTLPTNDMEIQHTILTLDSLVDPTTLPGSPSINQIYVTVELTPFVIDSIISGYITTGELTYTEVPPGPLTPDPTGMFGGPPSENFYTPTPVNSFVVLGDVTQIFTDGSVFDLIGTPLIFNVLYTRYDSVNDVTIIRPVQTIPTTITAGEIKIREKFPGYDEVITQRSSASGSVSSTITDRVIFNWQDALGNDVINGYQFLIKTATAGTNEIEVNGTVEGIVNVGDTVQILESITNNGTHTVTNVSGSIITLGSALTTAIGGFIEKL